MDNFASKSYDSHLQHHATLMKEKEARLFTMKNANCVAYINGISSLEKSIKPLITESCEWLTVGDYNGFEAKYLCDNGQNAVVSDISDLMLKEAQSDGLIKEIARINVDNIDFPDGKFDYVICREAMHHFPRPYIGLYEMIRVAQKGVVVIEPVDPVSVSPILLTLKKVCDMINPMLINRIWKNRFSWEIVGNYVFKLSDREIEKIAMGINLPCVAFKKFNVLLHVSECNDMQVPVNKKALKIVERKLFFKNLKSKLGVVPYNSICGVIFKELPSETVLRDMEEEGFRVVKLPKNPYI